MDKLPICFICEDRNGFIGINIKGKLRFVCGECSTDRSRKISEFIETQILGTIEKEDKDGDR